MQQTVLDHFLSAPLNDHTINLMVHDLENQLFPPTYRQSSSTNNMNYITDVLDNNNASSSSNDAYCVSPHALMASPNLDAQFEQMEFTSPISVPQPQLSANSLGMSPLPDLWDDMGEDDFMFDELPVTSHVPKIPFKPSSPYYHSSSPAIHTDPAFFNNYFPLTVSPQDAVLKRRDDDDDYSMATLPGFKESSKFHQQDYTNFGQTVAPAAEFEEPEAMDEDEDDEDNEYDEVLISSSDDELEFDDDLYTPQVPSSMVPGLTSFGSQSQQPPAIAVSAPIQYNSPKPHLEAPIDYEFTPETLHLSPLESLRPHTPSLPTPFPSPSHAHSHAHSHRRTFSNDHRNKRLPVSHTGPHRCDRINLSTGKPCSKVFSRPYDLIRHQDTIHAPVRKTFKCEMCGEDSKTFSRMDALSRHVRVKHSKVWSAWAFFFSFFFFFLRISIIYLFIKAI